MVGDQDVVGLVDGDSLRSLEAAVLEAARGREGLATRAELRNRGTAREPRAERRGGVGARVVSEPDLIGGVDGDPPPGALETAAAHRAERARLPGRAERDGGQSRVGPWRLEVVG